MLVFGSTAMKYWFSDYDQEPKDVDWLSTLPMKTWQGIDGKKHEVHWCDSMETVLLNNKHSLYVDPVYLYTIKLSHLPWDLKNGKWWKHLKDTVFLQNKGLEYDKEFLKNLETEWEKLHGSKSHIKLQKPLKEFFNDNVKREYNHDELHEYFKIQEVPAYSLIQSSDDSALVSEDLFQNLSEYQKCCTVLEEIFVISQERNLSFSEGYKHVVTKLSKGWWNLFCRLNAEKILSGFQEEKKVYQEKRRKFNAKDARCSGN